jgi:inosose dehydratase
MGTVTRRGFLATIGGGAVVLGCGDNLQESRFAGFNLAIQSWTFREFSLEQTLTFIANLGLTRIDLDPQVHFPLPATDDAIAMLHASFAAHGLDCMTSGIGALSSDHTANRDQFEIARRLGVRNIQADAPHEALDSAELLVAEYDVRLGIHNHGPGSLYSTIADVLAALERRDPRIATIIDTGHYLRSGIDPVDAIRAFSGRIAGIHLKDVVASEPGAPDAVLGEGVLDVRGVFRAMRQSRIPNDVSVSLEYEANPADPFDDVVRGLDHAAAAAHASR